MTCVIPSSRSSTTDASWYVAVPSGRTSVVPPARRTAPSSSRAALPAASARSAASAYSAPRSLCRSGPSSNADAEPREVGEDRLLPSFDRARRDRCRRCEGRRSPSRSSANRRFATAVSAFPRCSDPVGLGAKRTRTRHSSIVTWPRLRGDALEPGADRRVRARARSRPRARRACTRTARCRRSSSGRRRGTARLAELALHRVERGVPALLSRRQPVGEVVRRRPSTASQNRATAMYGSWLYCSKNIHWSTWARSYASSGTYCVPSPKYQRIAFDSASGRPSSSTTVGTRSAGLSSPRSSARLERSTTSTSTVSYCDARAARAGAAPCSSCPRPPSCRGASSPLSQARTSRRRIPVRAAPSPGAILSPCRSESVSGRSSSSSRVLVLLFGSSRVPKIARDLGRSVREVKETVEGIDPRTSLKELERGPDDRRADDATR